MTEPLQPAIVVGVLGHVEWLTSLGMCNLRYGEWCLAWLDHL
jgi:hypothetical protein